MTVFEIRCKDNQGSDYIVCVCDNHSQAKKELAKLRQSNTHYHYIKKVII